MVLSCNLQTGLLLGVAFLGLRLAVKIITGIFDRRKLDRWKDTPKDVVILHGFPRGKTCPNLSPFVLKVETYLRMTGISYKVDTTDTIGPKGKTPWISLNGQHIPDSQFIIQFLNRKFDKNLNRGKYSEEKLAVAKLVRLTLEEHFFWGLVLYRMDYGFHFLSKLAHIPALVPMWLVNLVVARKMKKFAWGQGLGRHSQEQVYEITTDALRAVSTVLGRNKFILGDEPCEEDCAIFGMLVQTIWGLPSSPYEKLANGELSNIKEYCERMKGKYWPDWDRCLY